MIRKQSSPMFFSHHNAPCTISRPSGWKIARVAVPILLACAGAFISTAQAESNGVAPKPPMGWSSWSFVRKTPTEANIKAQASGMSTSGLVAHGYQYINIDDFYYLNPATTVDANGRWVVDTTKFPDGMAAMAAYVHGLGLKFGMYMTPGIPVAAYKKNTPIPGTSYHAQDIVSNTTTYANNYNYGNGSMYNIDYTKPGAQAFINSWANLLASYGIDYLKLDGVGDSTTADVEAWSAALQQTGRPIHFELSNSLDHANGAIWREYANGWRIAGDIESYASNTSSYPLTKWSNVANRFTLEPEFTEWSGSGGWNDLDSLEVGNGTNDGLTTDQRQTMVTLWVMSCSPLFLGVDLTNLDSGDMPLITNDAVLAIDQSGAVGAPLSYNTTTQVWHALQADGSYAVALFNTGTTAATVTVNWADLGIVGNASVTDLWSQTSLGTMSGGFSATLVPYGSRLLRVTPATPIARYMADAAGNTVGGACVLSSNTVGSDGVKAGYVGMGGTITFNNVTVNQAGTYNVTFLYMDGDSGRSAQISVNGGTAMTVAFAGGGSWTTRVSKTLLLALQAGSNSITIGNSTAYAPDFDSLVVQPLTPTQSWCLNYFGTASDTGAAADNVITAGDGLSNLLKYALGLNPLAPAVSPVTQSTTSGYLQLSVPKNPAATDIVYMVEVTGDLTNPGSWTATGTTVDQNTATLLQVHDNTPVSAGVGRFIRLQVTRP